MPFSHKKLSGHDYFKLEPLLKPGMVFLTHTRGELSNLVNPGFWKHGAIYTGKNRVTEALGRGVVATDLVTFLLKKDYVLVVSPMFASPAQMADAVVHAMSYEGSPYDFQFEFNDKAFYCYEVIYRAYRDALAPDAMPFVLRESLGVPVIIGDDFERAVEKWTTVWDSRLSV